MKRTQQRIIQAIALLMIACITAGIFVSCGGEPSSSGTSNKQQANAHVEWEPPPEYDPIEIPTYEIPKVEVKETSPSVDQNGTASTVRYAASRESDRYHRPSCYYVDNILPENLFYFSSESAARRAGYYPCSVCNP